MTATLTPDFLCTACGTDNPLLLALRGGGVRRFHTETTCQQQSVAEHSWRMAIIIHYLWPDRKELLFAVLVHDIAEGLLGDIPAPVKRQTDNTSQKALEREYEEYLGLTQYTSLSGNDRTRLKCADYLELVATCAQQTTREAQRIVENGVQYVREAAQRLPEAEYAIVMVALAQLTYRPDTYYLPDQSGQDNPFGFIPGED